MLGPAEGCCLVGIVMFCAPQTPPNNILWVALAFLTCQHSLALCECKGEYDKRPSCLVSGAFIDRYTDLWVSGSEMPHRFLAKNQEPIMRIFLAKAKSIIN